MLLNFTDGSNATNQYSLDSLVYGLYPGDCSGDNHTVDASARSAARNKRNQSGYLREDVNLSGTVDAADRSICWNLRNTSVQLP